MLKVFIVEKKLSPLKKPTTTKNKLNMSKHIISVDAMGGDFGPSELVPACVQFVKSMPDASIILVGNVELITPLLESVDDAIKQKIEVVATTEVVTSDDSPAVAMRNKKKSSMRVAVNLVHEGRASACVSSGNTGALMAISKFVLKTVKNLKRPALLTRIPNRDGTVTRLLDVGANVDSDAEQLSQFAVMGHVAAKYAGGIESPTVGLLNIGSEDIKGNLAIKSASDRLKKIDVLNYIGFVESGDIFTGNVDVVATDGFAGNICLKSMEGTASFFAFLLKKSFKANLINRLLAVFCLPVLKTFKTQMDPRKYNGASFLGLRGVVVKSHGDADRVAFLNALHEAYLEISKDIPALLERYFDHDDKEPSEARDTVETGDIL
jgi:phosphate acyltransferase